MKIKLNVKDKKRKIAVDICDADLGFLNNIELK